MRSFLIFRFTNGSVKSVRHERHFELPEDSVVVDVEGRVFSVSKSWTRGERQMVWLDQEPSDARVRP